MRHERIYLDSECDEVWIETYIANDGDCRDALLVIPGGGYGVVCHHSEGEPIALAFAARGYNTFTLNYRAKQGMYHYPTQLIDASRAMLYLRENAESLKINAQRIFAVGFSAGGHLCGSLATMYNYPEIVREFGEQRCKKIRPEGVILSYPVTTMHAATHEGSFENLTGLPYGEIPEDMANRFSIDTALTSESSPMFLWHTVEDELVPEEGTLVLALALARKKVPHRVSIFPYGPHGLTLSNGVTAKDEAHIQPMVECWVGQADEWMKSL